MDFLKRRTPMVWIVAVGVAVATAACQNNSPAVDVEPSAASSSAASAQDLCQSFYPFLAAVGFMSNVEVLGLLEGAEPAAVAEDLRSTAESVVTTGAVLEPLAPEEIHDEIAVLVDAAIEVETALLEGSAASEASELWARPGVGEAETAVEDYYNDSTCGPN
jgi:hypothetical protein